MSFSLKTGLRRRVIGEYKGGNERNSLLFSVVLSVSMIFILFVHSVVGGSMSDNYVVTCAQSFEVIRYTTGDPQDHGRVIYRIDQEGDRLITAVAYDPIRKRVAVATKSKNSKKNTAKIIMLDEPDFSPSTEIIPHRDSIDGMSFDRQGKLAFVSNDISHDLPGDLSYLDNSDGSVHMLANGKHFLKPSWGNDSKKIYFAYLSESKRGIAYVELTQPNVIKPIADGTSVSVSASGIVAYLTSKGEIVFLHGTEQQRTNLRLSFKYTDPKFTDGIRFVDGTNDLILQHYKKSIVYDLMVVRPPYTDVTTMLSNIGMRDYDATRP